MWVAKTQFARFIFYLTLIAASRGQMVRWTKADKGDSCDMKCNALGRTCDASRMNAVSTGATFQGVDTAMVATSGADAGLGCAGYSSSTGSVAPSFFHSPNDYCYANSAASSTCAASSSSYTRLCCCLGSGENNQTVCPVQASDCGAGMMWDPTTSRCLPSQTGCPVSTWKQNITGVPPICVECAATKYGLNSNQDSEALACSGSCAFSWWRSDNSGLVRDSTTGKQCSRVSKWNASQHAGWQRCSGSSGKRCDVDSGSATQSMCCCAPPGIDLSTACPMSLLDCDTGYTAFAHHERGNRTIPFCKNYIASTCPAGYCASIGRCIHLADFCPVGKSFDCDRGVCRFPDIVVLQAYGGAALFWLGIAANFAPFIAIAIAIVIAERRRRRAAEFDTVLDVAGTLAAAASQQDNNVAWHVAEADAEAIAANGENNDAGIANDIWRLGLRRCGIFCTATPRSNVHNSSILEYVRIAQLHAEDALLHRDESLVPLCCVSPMKESFGVGLFFHDLTYVGRVIAAEVLLAVPLMLLAYIRNMAIINTCLPTPIIWQATPTALSPLVYQFFYAAAVFKDAKEGTTCVNGVLAENLDVFIAFLEAAVMLMPICALIVASMRAARHGTSWRAMVDRPSDRAVDISFVGSNDIGCEEIAAFAQQWGDVDEVVVLHLLDAQHSVNVARWRKATLAIENFAAAVAPDLVVDAKIYLEKLRFAEAKANEAKTSSRVRVAAELATSRAALVDADTLQKATIVFGSEDMQQQCLADLTLQLQRSRRICLCGGKTIVKHDDVHIQHIYPSAAPHGVIFVDATDDCIRTCASRDACQHLTRKCPPALKRCCRHSLVILATGATAAVLVGLTLLYINLEKWKDDADESKCGENSNWLAVDSSHGLKAASLTTSMLTEGVKVFFRIMVLPYLIRVLSPTSKSQADAHRMVIASAVSALHLGCTFLVVIFTVAGLPSGRKLSRPEIIDSEGKRIWAFESIWDTSVSLDAITCADYRRYAIYQRFFRFCFATLLSSTFSVLIDELVLPKTWAMRVLCWKRNIAKGASQQQLNALWATNSLDMWLLHVYSIETLFTTLLVAAAYPAVVIAGAFKVSMLYIFFRISLLRVRPRRVYEGDDQPYRNAKSMYVLAAVCAVFAQLYCKVVVAWMSDPKDTLAVTIMGLLFYLVLVGLYVSIALFFIASAFGLAQGAALPCWRTWCNTTDVWKRCGANARSALASTVVNIYGALALTCALTSVAALNLLLMPMNHEDDDSGALVIIRDIGPIIGGICAVVIVLLTANYAAWGGCGCRLYRVDVVRPAVVIFMCLVLCLIVLFAFVGVIVQTSKKGIGTLFVLSLGVSVAVATLLCLGCSWNTCCMASCNRNCSENDDVLAEGTESYASRICPSWRTYFPTYCFQQETIRSDDDDWCRVQRRLELEVPRAIDANQRAAMSYLSIDTWTALVDHNVIGNLPTDEELDAAIAAATSEENLDDALRAAVREVRASGNIAKRSCTPRCWIPPIKSRLYWALVHQHNRTITPLSWDALGVQYRARNPQFTSEVLYAPPLRDSIMTEVWKRVEEGEGSNPIVETWCLGKVFKGSISSVAADVDKYLSGMRKEPDAFIAAARGSTFVMNAAHQRGCAIEMMDRGAGIRAADAMTNASTAGGAEI